MNPLALTMAALTVVCVLIVYAVQQKNKPKNVFIGWEPGRDTVIVRRLRSIAGDLSVPVGKGRKVAFPMKPGFNLPRSDGKGNFFLGNLATGQLMKPAASGTFEFVDGLELELAKADGREKRLTNSVNGNEPMLIKALLIMSALTLLFLVGFIWKFMQG